MTEKKFITMFLLGQYGAGKDTHGPFIADMFNLTHLGFSAFLSQDADARRHYVEHGILVPDHDVFRIFGAYPLEGLLLNGFPRTIDQLRFILRKCQIGDIAIVYLDVTDEIAIRRMENRVICSVCGTATSLLKGHVLGGPCKIEGCHGILKKRPDDTPEGIVKRMASFREKTLPILTEAEKYGMAIYRIKVEHEQPIEKTQEMITQSLCKSVMGFV